jgi:hypothetical protein
VCHLFPELCHAGGEEVGGVLLAAGAVETRDTPLPATPPPSPGQAETGNTAIFISGDTPLPATPPPRPRHTETRNSALHVISYVSSNLKEVCELPTF